MITGTLLDRVLKQIAPSAPSRSQATYDACDLILCASGQTDRSNVIADTIKLTPEQEALLEQLISEYVFDHKPIAYIVGKVSFGPLTLRVKAPILIPRQETEEMVSSATSYLMQQQTPLTILDIGTGTGCIALFIAKYCPQHTVIGVDINQDAIALAQENAQINNIQNVTFKISDLAKNISDHSIDFIISNPPYISESDYLNLPASVKNWEDRRALVAESDGLAVYARILEQAPRILRQNNLDRHFYFEIGSITAGLAALITMTKHFIPIGIINDLSEKPRWLVGRQGYLSEENLFSINPTLQS